MDKQKRILLIILLVVATVASTSFYTYKTYYFTPVNSQTTSSSSVFSIADQLNQTSDTPNATVDFNMASSSDTTTDTDVASSTENLNATERIAHDLFTQYATIQQNTKIDATNASAFTTQYLQTAKIPTDVKAQQYTNLNLIVVPTNPTSLQQYHTSVMNLTLKYWPKSGNEMTIMQNAFNSNDLSILAQLQPFIDKHSALLAGLLKIPVPTLAVNLHLQILNNLSLYVADLTTIQNTDKDPVSSIAGVRLFLNYQQGMLTSFINLQKFFTENKVL